MKAIDQIDVNGQATETILGIETSCDETAAAIVVRNADGTGRIVSNVVRSQLDEHAAFGGVVPELAARAHVAWLEQGFAEGLLLIAGRQVPRVGGFVLCRGHKAEVEAYAASDPFVTEGVATVRVTEMAASFASEALAATL